MGPCQPVERWKAGSWSCPWPDPGLLATCTDGKGNGSDRTAASQQASRPLASQISLFTKIVYNLLTDFWHAKRIQFASRVDQSFLVTVDNAIKLFRRYSVGMVINFVLVWF